ncbi:MAG: Nif3-like dinuclear metal center hexameric protein [Clostridia bacterium]|nr:Nif3-like dinuclear metal center hexameric protein [Clostridia bacterium]
MPKVNDVITAMREIAPEKNTFGHDNVGLIVGDENAEVSHVLCCLDVTQGVIDEAIERGAQLIICHHPMIFLPISSVTFGSPLGKKIIKAIKNGISIYAAHTNLDFSMGGINDYLMTLLKTTDVVPLDPYISEVEGFGRVGNFMAVTTARALKEKLVDLLHDKYVGIIGNPDVKISRVAIINGSGGGDTEYIDMAMAKGADCLITGEVKHHVAIYAVERGFTVIEAGHYTSEQVFIPELARILIEKLSEKNICIEVFTSLKENNPIV